MSGQMDMEQKSEKENVSSDKLKSLRGLVFGSRAMQFDALLKRVPTSEELTAIARHLGKPEIDHAIFDLDGTLVPPYAPIPEKVIEGMREYQDQGRTVTVYSNSPYSKRFDPLKDNHIQIAATCFGKPTLRGFKSLCDQQKIDPAHTAMIGNFPVTDMPLVDEGAPPYFPLNMLVDSIPPDRELLDSWSRYFRARLFHAINLTTTGIVCLRKPNLLRNIPGVI